MELFSKGLCEDKELRKMQSFSRAINANFKNGKAKLYCYTLAEIISEDLCDTTILPRDTLLDDFKLLRDRGDKAERRTGLRSGSDIDCDMLSGISTHSSKNGKPDSGASSSSNLEGNRTSDMTVASNRDLPLVIFECKSKYRHSEIKEGI